ncbi:MAG: Rab family GTPase [Promethearchaeota archaeon]
MIYDDETGTYNIILYGRGNVGVKTFIKQELRRSQDNGLKNTIGVGLYYKVVDTNLGKVKLSFWHFTSNPTFKYLWDQYLPNSHGVMFMYDISNSYSFYSLHINIMKVRERLHGDHPILLIGNKLDSEVKRDVSREEVDQQKKHYNISFSMEISSKTGENIEELFLRVSEMMQIHWKKLN